MPYLNLCLSKKVDDSQSEKILSALSQIVSESLGKPQSYTMISISESKIIMASSTQDAAFADLRTIGGVNPQSTGTLSRKISQLLNSELGIDPKRVYINFSDIEASNWGWNGSTFG